VATYVLLPGAGSDPWYWHRVTPLLEERGHAVVAVDLPVDDDRAGFGEYADVTVEAIGDRRDLILVAQSLAGFTAPLVCERVPVDLMVLVAAMVPRPGESPRDWWANTGQQQAMRDAATAGGWTAAYDDPVAMFLHDVPADVAEESARHVREQSETPFERPYELRAWPDVPTRFLLCRDDRFFPAAFQHRVVRERLGITPDEMAGGHLPALARPAELVDRLETYRSGT
jgi:hypothetical protein